MNQSELERHIQKKTLSNNFVFFGESSFLIDLYTKKVSTIEDASMLSLYHDEYDFNSAKAHLSQASLFGDRNVLILKSEKKIDKKQVDALIDLCEKNADNILVYAYYGSDYTSYKNAFAKKSTMSVRFFHPKDAEALNIVMQIAHEKKVKIDRHSLSHLLQLQNGDVALACNEIEKFSIYDKEITIKDIDNLVFGLAEISVEALIRKILNKKDFTQDLRNLLDHGEDEIRILTGITSYITQLYMFNIYMRINGAPNALAILGYAPPSFVVEEKVAQAHKLKPATYAKLHELLLESELKMKSKDTDTEAILLSTLIRIQKLL